MASLPSLPLCTTTSMAQLLEEVDRVHLLRQLDICEQIFPDEEIRHLAAGGGTAAVTLPLFGRKLNRIVGFGMAGQVSIGDLVEVDPLYRGNDTAGQVDLCPHADATAIDVLNATGYVANGWISSYVRGLSDVELNESNSQGVEVFQVSPRQLDQFCRISLAGYQDGGRPKLLLETLARSAALRRDTRIYFATVDGEVAGSAGLALIETVRGNVAHLYIDSTLPMYRGRGVQLALIQKRLADARSAGYELASVETRPASGSARNIERAGFRLAYTKTTFVQRVKSGS